MRLCTHVIIYIGAYNFVFDRETPRFLSQLREIQRERKRGHRCVIDHTATHMAGDLLQHFETGSYVRNATFLDDVEYGRALDVFVKGCADILVQDESTGEVLLVRRTSHPQPDWWVVGGRLRAGDSPAEGAARNLERETGVRVEPSRLAPLCVASMLFQKRKQPPAGNGTADVSCFFLARVTAEQRRAVRLDGGEHSDARWVRPEALAGDGGYHPVLRRAARHVFIAEAYRALEAAVAVAAGDGGGNGGGGGGENGSDNGDAAIAAAARELVRQTREAQACASLPVPFVDPPTAA